MEFILNDTGADNLILDIQSLKADKERFTIIANQQIKVITDKLQAKNKTIDDGIEFNKSQLRAFFLTVDKKSTKTQESYSLLSGKLILKKATQKIMHDDVKLINFLKEHAVNCDEYMEDRITTKLKWSTMKKDLSITNGKIIRNSTGEVLEGVEGLSIEEVQAKFDIK